MPVRAGCHAASPARSPANRVSVRCARRRRPCSSSVELGAAIIMARQMIAFPQYRRRARLALLLGALAAGAQAADESCVPEPPHLQAVLSPDGAIRISSCELHVAANGDMELLGKVTVNINGRELHCERLSYVASTHQLQPLGTVSYEDPGLRGTGQ